MTGHADDWLLRRRPLNEASRIGATHHGDPWTNAEDARVLAWDRREETLPALARELGRTTEAVRQRVTALLREPRDRPSGTTTRKRQPHRSQTSSEPALGTPCPVCGLHHPGDC